MSDDEEVSMAEVEKLRRENEALRKFYAKTKAAAISSSAMPGTAGVGVSVGGSSASQVVVSLEDLETDADMIAQSFAAVNKSMNDATVNKSTNDGAVNYTTVNTTTTKTSGGSKARRPLRQLPTFGGRTGEDAETWVQRIAQLASSLDWDQATHAGYLYAGLDERAAKWATRLDATVRQDPKQLGEALIRTFMPRAPNSYIDEFLERAQLRDETVNQLAAEIRYLAQTAKLETVLVSRFRAGVRHDLQKKVEMLDSATTFEELVRRASEWETQLNQQKAKKGNIVAAVSEEVGYALHSSISAEVGRTVAAVMSEFKEGLRPLLSANNPVTPSNPTRSPNPQQVQERVCYHCGEKGHIVRYCKEKILEAERRRVAREQGESYAPKKQPVGQTGTPTSGGATVGN